MCDACFEISLRHLHKKTVPLDEACSVQALLQNRSSEALKRPGCYVPVADGSVTILMPPEVEAVDIAEAPGATDTTCFVLQPPTVDMLAVLPPTPIACMEQRAA
eukprot:452922-Karenia_brevis.AAC.1